jgi:pantetheine-phosphate adenylyltransferase
VAVLPATFDPPTNGHLEIVRRAAGLFDEVVVAVYATPNKQTMFDAAERLELVGAAVEELGLPNVRVREFGSRLIVDVAREEGATVLVKGLRAVSDFDYEFQMSHMNAQLAPEVATVAVFASAEYSFLSSTLVREVAKLGGDVSAWVPAAVQRRMRERFPGRDNGSGADRQAGILDPDRATVPDAEGGADRMGGFVAQDERVR